MKKLLLLITVFSIVLGLAACTKSETQTSESNATKEIFKIGAIPDQNASKLNRRFDELAAYIAEETDLEVEYVPTVDYAALVSAFERGDVDLAWFGGLTGVQARELVPSSEAIAQRPRDEKFMSVFVASKELNLASIEDVAGHSLTFGSESSTSGHLMPRYFLMEAGINLDMDLDGLVNYSGSHDKTWKLVESGAFEVGALNIAVWESAVKDSKVDLSKVDVFYTTPEYFDYNWTINDVDSKYGAGTKENVKNALLSFGDNNTEIMELFGDTKFIESSNDKYDAILTVAKELGIIQ